MLDMRHLILVLLCLCLSLASLSLAPLSPAAPSPAPPIPVILPWNMVVNYGNESSFALFCKSSSTTNVWKRDSKPNNPIFDGHFLSPKIANKYRFMDSTNKALKISYLEEDDGDIYYCTEEGGLGRERKYYGVVIVSDHRNMICTTNIQGIQSHKASYQEDSSQHIHFDLDSSQKIIITCSFRLGATKYCHLRGIWETSVPGVNFSNHSKGGVLQMEYSAHGISEVQQIYFNLSGTFDCNLNKTDDFNIYKDQPLTLGYLYTSPTFNITPVQTTTTTLHLPSTSPNIVAASTASDPMMLILMVVMTATILIIIFFIIFLTIFFIRRKRSRLESLGDYIHPMTTPSYCPSSICMSENVAYRRNNIQENSYTPNTITTSFSHDDLLNMQPLSLSYQPLLPGEKMPEDYYDRIRESKMVSEDRIPEEDAKYDSIPADEWVEKGEKDGGNGGKEGENGREKDGNDEGENGGGSVGYGDFSGMGEEKNVYMAPDLEAE